MKKRIALIISVLLFAALTLSPFFAYATIRTDSGEVPLLQEGDFEILEESRASYGSLALSAEQTIYNQLLNVSSEVNVTGYGVTVDNVEGIYANVINDNPDLFYVSSSYRIRYYASGAVVGIIPQYSMTSNEIAAAKVIFDKGVERALSEVDDSMSDLQKALVLHDYICNFAVYPADVYNNDLPIYHSAYGFLYNNVAVCAGYTLTYSYLLHELGIESEYVSSEGMEHAWNKVKIDGNWYNVDITFDDVAYAEGYNTYGTFCHSCFMKSDSYFASVDGACHYGGVTNDSCSATSTTYDSYFWNSVVSRIYVINGNYYYLNPTSSSASTLTKRIVSGGMQTLATAFTSGSLTFSSDVKDESGTVHEREFDVILNQLTYLDGRFYVSTNKKIYSVTLEGRKYLITSYNDYPIGISAIDNGNLVYQLFSNKTTVIEIDKMQYYNNYFTTVKGSNYNNYPDINLDGVINAKDYACIIKNIDGNIQ